MRWIGIVCCCVLWLQNATGEILDNADFSRRSPVGLPLVWELRNVSSQEQCAVSDGVLTLRGGKEAASAVQPDLKLIPGKEYRLTYEANADVGTRYRTYVEWTQGKGNAKKWQSFGSWWNDGNGAWRYHEIPFRMAADTSRPYCALTVSPGGVLRIRNLSLQEFQPEILPNADFRKQLSGKPVVWEIRGGGQELRFENGIAVLPEGTTLIHHSLALEPNKPFQLSFEARSSSGCELRAYFESARMVDGKREWQAAHTGFFAAPESWRTYRLAFQYPAGTAFSHLVFQTQGRGTAEIRKIQVEAIGEREVFGGVLDMANAELLDGADDGKPLIRVRRGAGGGQGARLRKVALLPNTEYRLSFRVKGEGSAGNVIDMHPFRIQISYPGMEEKSVSDWDDVWNDRFQGKEFIFTTPDFKGGYGELELTVNTPGTVLFGALALERYRRPEGVDYEITLDAPFYRNSIYASVPVSTIRGKARVGKDTREADVSLMCGKQAVFRKTLPAERGEVVFGIPAADLTEGEYELTVRFRAGDAEKNVSTVIRKLPPAPREVVMTETRDFLINGKPFYPVICWRQPAEEARYLASRGINLYIYVGATSERLALAALDQAAEAGLMLCFSIHHAERSDSEYLTGWKHRLFNILTPKVMEHPALFGYFLADEPAWGGIPLKNLVASYDILRNIDPYHPVWINEAPRGNWALHARYSRPCDIYGIDIYPVPWPSSHSGLEEKGPACVGQYAAGLLEATGGRKAIWMALQGFSWWTINGKDSGAGYPTSGLTRFMAFDAIVNGANAVGYWGTQYILTPGFWEVLLTQTEELHRLSGLLASGRKVSGVTVTPAGFRVLALEVNRKRFLIAVNASDKAQVGHFSGLSGVAEMTVIGEGRRVTPADGVFADRFEPFGVHIYAEGSLPPPVWTLPSVPNGNPLEEHIRKRLNAVYYNGSANWIWERKAASQVGSKIRAVRRLTLSAKPVTATMLLAADDAAELFVNGKRVGETVGWSRMTSFDLTGYLKAGDNVIEISAEDRGRLPCGILADLQLKLSDGTTRSMISDASWLVKDEAGRECAAFVVAPYGGGVWGDKVEKGE